MSNFTTSDLEMKKAIPPSDFHDHISRIVEVSADYLKIPTDLDQRLKIESEPLLIPTSLLEECAAALTFGNIVLQGPPGTGKSSLARALAKAFNSSLLPVTAHEDWSTFEVIGRQELRVNPDGAEQIIPVDGHFTEAVIQCANSIVAHEDDPEKPQATWLLIDELNRAHPDKAFGELFSVLGSDSPVDITLAYQKPGNNVFVVPRRFRIIGTINSIDKQFVNSLSQGLRRRFTFITVDLPSKRKTDEVWGNIEPDASIASREFDQVINKAVLRVSSRISKPVSELEAFMKHIDIDSHLKKMFDLVEKVRYADEESAFPFIPIGTAPMIDTAELFLIRAARGGLLVANASKDIDWAVSVKLAPLFDAGMVNRDKLVNFANTVAAPFSGFTRLAMLAIASDGLFYVE